MVVDKDRWLSEDHLKYFESGLDHRLGKYVEVLEEQTGQESDLYLIDIGGSGVLYGTDQDERPANDLDFAVAHTGHPNDTLSYEEKACIEQAFAMYGLAPRKNDERGYTPANGAINVFVNVEHPEEDSDWFDTWFESRDEEGAYNVRSLGNPAEDDDRDHAVQLWAEYSGNDLPLPKADVFGGSKPMETYPMDWFEDYAEDITVNGRTLDRIKRLSLPALTARKVYRATVDNQGSEDEAQKFDLHTIYDYVKHRMEGDDRIQHTMGSFREEFKDAWNGLIMANKRDVADFEDDVLHGETVDRDWGWRYFKRPENRADPAEF